ncbi:MAG: glycosyltransferase family 2 protein [Planctomycetota bacterium]
MSLTVSVVVPVFNGGKAFRKCLESLLANQVAPAEIIIVDDGSTDGSPAVARELGLQVLSTGGRCGPATARNLGARHAHGDILWFVDADCTVPPGSIAFLQTAFSEHPDWSAIIGSYDDQPAEPNLLSQYKNLHHHYVHQTSGRQGFTFWGACGAIRRQVFAELNGFDERYQQASIEDIELGYRAVARQKKIAICPELQIKHHKRWSTWGLLRTDFFLRAIPWSKLILRQGRMENCMNISRTARWRVALSGLIAFSAVAAIFHLSALLVTLPAILALAILDWRLLSWFRLERGWLFMLSIVPWHWFSHFYSGVAFAYVNVVALLSKLLRREDWELGSSLESLPVALDGGHDDWQA